MAKQKITATTNNTPQDSKVAPREQQQRQEPPDSSDDEADVTKFRHLDASSKSIASISNITSNKNSKNANTNINTKAKAKTTTAFSLSSPTNNNIDNPTSTTSSTGIETDSTHSGNHARDKQPSGNHARDKQPSPNKSKSTTAHKRNDSQNRKSKNAVPKSKKRRSKLASKKTIMERKWPKKRKLPLSSFSPKKLKGLEGSLVQHLEKLHYGKDGKYESFSVIPNVFVTKLNSNSKRKFIHASKSALFQPCSTRPRELVFPKGTNIDQWVNQVGTSHLLELGWVYNGTLNQFNLIADETSVRLSRERLVDIVSGSKDRLTIGSTPELVDQFAFAYRLEEEILMDSVQRVIDLDAMVQSTSCSLDSPDVMMASVDVSGVSADDSIASSSEAYYDEDLFSVDGNESVETPVSAQKSNRSKSKGLSSISRSTSTKVPRTIFPKNNTSVSKPSRHKFFEKCKDFPKYIADSNDLLFTEEILKSIESIECKIRMIDSSEDDETVELHFRGSEATVDEALGKLIKFAQKEIAGYNSRELLKDENSIEIDIKMNAMDDVGFKARKGTDCLWISEITEGGQLQKIIGTTAKRGVVITEMGLLQDGKWEKVRSIKGKKKLINRAKESFTLSKNEKDKWILLRIYLTKDENIACMDVTHVVPRNGQRFRCRNGPYRGKCRVPERGKIPSKKRQLSARPIDDEQKPAKKTKTSSPPSERTKINTDKDTSFQHFSAKMKEVKLIEYRYKNVHLQAANGSMWNQHKNIFGEHCDSQCSCVAQLKVLTSNVVTDFVSSKQKKDPNWQPSSNIHVPIGFADSFCPKFHAKVQHIFPNDSPENVLSKLVDMWRYGHQKQRQFNGKCNNFCNCAVAWEEVFLPICKGETASKAKAKVKVKTAGSIVAKNVAKNVATPMQASFELTFKPCKASLGLFLETKFGQDGRSRCVVTSVDPRDKRVARVSCGSSISSYQVGNSPSVNVNSHNQVEKIFSTLHRADRTSLTLKFFPAGNATQVDCRGDWTVDTNAWIGPSKNQGWAGGAMQGHNNRRKPVSSIGPTKALGHTEKYLMSLPQHAKKKIHDAQRTESITKTPKVARKELAPRNAQFHVFQQGSIQSEIGSNRTLPSADNKSRIKPQPKQPAKVIVPAPKILRAKGSSASGAKVRIDETNNEVEVFSWCQEEHTRPKTQEHRPCSQIAEQEKLIENVLGKKLVVLALSLKHCTHVHELNYTGPVDEMKKRVIQLEEEARFIDREDITPVEKVERMREVQCQLLENNLKVKLLKVYARIYTYLQIVGKTTPAELGKKNINIIDHIIKEHRNLGSTLKRSLSESKAFREQTLEEGMELDFDANIDVNGVSILHVATIIADDNIVKDLLQKGVQITRSATLGTPLDLAKLMHRESQSRGKLDWANRYLRIISRLENYMHPRR